MNYDAQGGINIGGCADTIFKIFITLKYPIGTQAYSLKKAQKGIIEPHVIKSYYLINEYIIMYTDTYNELWGENDLCDSSTATNLVKIYLENQATIAQINARECR